MTKTLLVSYDLNRPGQNYAGLIEYLKGFDAWWHHLDSTWMVVTTMTVSELRDKLSTFVDSGDEILVLNPRSGSWASWGLPTKATNWLKQNL